MKKELQKQIESDIFRVFPHLTHEGFNIWKKYKCMITHPYLRYMEVYRKAKFYSANNKLLAAWYAWRLFNLSIKYGYQINRNCTIGYGCYLGHRGSVVINGEAVIGDNVNIAQGVTIGAEARGKRKGVPIIGSNVWIGTNAVLVGKIVIGDDVLIAPNAYVNFDVPAHSIVVGNPGKIIYREHATKGYIQNPFNTEC